MPLAICATLKVSCISKTVLCEAQYNAMQLSKTQIRTSMHSSRMRTGRSLTVCRGLLLGGGGWGGWIWSPQFPPWVWAWIWSPLNFPPWVWAWIWSPSISPLGVGLDLIPLNFPLGCGPGSDPPQFPPWVWAWTWSPSISHLGVGLDLIPLNFPLGCGPEPDPLLGGGCLLLGGGLLGGGASFLRGISLEGVPPSWGVSLEGVPPWRGVPPWQGWSPSQGGVVSQHALRQIPPVNRITHSCKNITLATTSLRPVNIAFMVAWRNIFWTYRFFAITKLPDLADVNSDNLQELSQFTLHTWKPL